MRGLCLAAALLLPATAVHAANLIAEPGETHVLKGDLVLDGDDVVEMRGTADKPCVLDGNRHRIRSGPKWTGSIKFHHGTVRNLGGLPKRGDNGLISGPGIPAIELKVGGQGDVEIEHCTLDACAAIQLQTDDESTVAIRHNTLLDNTTVAISKDIGNSGDFFTATGNSRGRKFFQGNLVPRGKVVVRGANWLVGGDRDADSNLFIGLRIGIVADGEGTIVRGNYFHLRMPINDEFPYWSQISVFTAGRGVVGEHNVIRDGEWIVRFVEGEFRFNIITDIVDHDLMQNGSSGRIHHNLFLAGTSDSRQGSMSACIAVIYPPKNPGEGIEIFNNVFDGGGRLDVPAIEVAPKAFVTSLRNNVFFNFAHNDKYFKRPQAMVRTIWNDDTDDESPPRLGHADYNLFFSSETKTRRNYRLSVAGKKERHDSGFARHDIPEGGKIDEQVEPRFHGPLPKGFPYSDDEIRSRTIGVSKMLQFYRDAYTPGEGSPLVGTGDPADGPKTNIGAIGGPPGSDGDKFGRFGAQ